MFELFVLSMTAAILTVASVQDVRRREVSDGCWMAICILAVMVSAHDAASPWGLVRAAAVMLFALYMFSPRIHGHISLLTVGTAAGMMLVVSVSTFDPAPMVSALMSVFMILMYAFGMIRGGADAKALISLSLLYPVYPAVGCLLWQAVYPECLVFNPVVAATVLALTMSVVWTLIVVRRSGRTEGCGMGQYRTTIEDARGSFVWPLEDVREGRKVGIRVSDDTDPIYGRLESAGFGEVRVTPMIPFVPMTAVGMMAALLLGVPMGPVIF